ncbi:MAG: ribonuclease III [Candidatus Hydrogenedentes bacterium]|jgi:ribonuclease-3|nr:ribonuclease III [Candidatus Hydrogenedentota bacterium]
MDEERLAALRELTEALGLKLPSYEALDEALTHASCLCEPDSEELRCYESLEFLGDAVLDLAVSDFLFNRFPDGNPGRFTEMRATIVNRNSVAEVARRLGIGAYIRLSKGEEVLNGRNRLSLLADSLEAVIGAVYQTLGWAAAHAFICDAFASELNQVRMEAPVWDYKSKLQHYCQAQHIALPHFVTKDEGPDHKKVFFVDVFVQDQHLGSGRGSSKKEAEQRAAQQALHMIQDKK